jgi:hypothetical protein
MHYEPEGGWLAVQYSGTAHLTDSIVKGNRMIVTRPNGPTEDALVEGR